MESTATTERPKVIYVMGAGHSGSTVLGVALGNCAGVFYAGEVEEWLANSGARMGGSERTQFWNGVGESMNGMAEPMLGGEANRYVERASVVFRVDRWRARRRMLGRYRRVAEDLFRVIAHRAAATHVVDTSHFPLRARELQAVSGIDLYLVFLVRDARAVVESNLREISEHEVAERRVRTLVMNANLWLTQLLSVCVFLRHRRDRRIFVRHEAFVSDPAGVLRQILDRVDSSSELPDLTSLAVGVPLHGNRLLRSEVIAVRGSAESPPGSSRLTGVLQLPWATVFSRLQPVARAAAARD